MSHQYFATITWRNDSQRFTEGTYSRGHQWEFDGNITVPASSSPRIVPLPFSIANAVDPEEALVASLSSCHMLWFLSIAAEKGFLVESYVDKAIGVMGKNTEGKTAMTSVTLCPKVKFGGDSIPTGEQHEAMHELAHEECFIASSVKTEIFCQPEIV